MYRRLQEWFSVSSERKLLAVLLGVALASAIVFLVLALAMAKSGVHAEQEASAKRMAGLFEASLKNAMLKRDLPGLRDIVHQLGEVPGVREVMILNPGGEVRFASSDKRLGEHRPAFLDRLCLARGCEQSPPSLAWLKSQAGESMRIAWPVRNEARCIACHGPASEKPVNGILVVELSTSPGAQVVHHSSRYLIFAGLLAITVTAGSLAWALRRTVLKPLGHLTMVTNKLSESNLSVRANLTGKDELAQLGQCFDSMAERLANTLATLEAEHGFLQNLLDAIPDPVLVIDDSYRIVLANTAYRNLLKISGNCTGKTCHETSRNLTEPCPSTLVVCPLRELASDKSSVRTVMSLTCSDGHILNVEIDAASLIAADGRRLVVEVMRSLEEKIRFSQEQRLSAVGLLANGVAHEIRNPLASIRVALQGAQRRLEGKEIDRASLSGYLALVDHEIDRCVSITERLLQMSQPPASGDAHPTPVASAIRETLALLKEDAEARNITVSVDIQPDNLTVLADNAELRMLTLNLAQNAFHAMPNGGHLSILARIEGNAGELIFRDNGVGVSAEDLPLIFMPFFSRRADGKSGSGLGLAICKSMVERYGGSIHADSQAGQGCTMTIRFLLAGS